MSSRVGELWEFKVGGEVLAIGLVLDASDRGVKITDHLVLDLLKGCTQQWSEYRHHEFEDDPTMRRLL